MTITETPTNPALDAATIRKADAEAIAAAALAEKYAAEARKAQLEADKVADELRANRYTLADFDRAEQRRLASDYNHRVYRFSEPVAPGSAAKCMATLAEWSRIDGASKQPIEIVFNSPGGSIVDGLALFDFVQDIREDGHEVTTSCLGMAASMAGILLQAGDIRTMGRQSWLMIHEASFGAQGKIGDVEDTVDWVNMMQERILDIFASRSHMEREEIRERWERRNWWLSADDALHHGFIDAIR